MKKIVTWVVIADGGHARVLANEGPGKGLHPVSGAHWDGDDRPTRDIMSDKQGRTFDSAGHGRHAMEPSSDPRQQVENAFLNEVVEYLAAGAAKGKFDRLVLVAEPHALGTLRKQLPETLQKRMHGDLDRDLTKVPLDKIPEHLQSIMVL